MKVINQTVWNTAHLKAILQQAAERELEVGKRKVLRVTVSYTRGGLSSGCAWIGGRSATVRIRHPHSRSWKAKNANYDNAAERERLVLHFASVACHEFAHVRGQNHQTMSARYKWHGNWEAYVAWAKDLPLEVKASKAPAKPTVDAKLAHVLRMKKLAETRVKRATTILKRWKARERYYLKAAQRVTS